MSELQQPQHQVVTAQQNEVQLLLERLEINREVLLRQEKKRQLELVVQSQHPSTDDKKNEKKRRTEKEEDDVVDDSISTVQDVEFEPSMDMESDAETQYIIA